METSPASEILAVLGSIKESFFHVLPKLVVALFVLFVGWLVAWSLRVLVRRVVERFSKRIFRGNDRGRLAAGLGRQGTRAHRLEQHLLARLAGRDHGGERSRRSPGFDHLSGRSKHTTCPGSSQRSQSYSSVSSGVASSAMRQ